LELSKQILIEKENFSVAEVAFCCGFSSSQYFSTVFKKVEKCTPLEFRQKQLTVAY
jgi:AraC family L-rhamnose operon regulatory protein RhaS